MGCVRYDSYTDKFIYEEDLISTTATCTGCIQKPFEITEEAIDKIADAVVRKLRANPTMERSEWMNSWCESCARKGCCYTMEIRPRCYVATTNTASGTPESYLAKSLRYSQDSKGRATDRASVEQTEPSDDCQWK